MKHSNTCPKCLSKRLFVVEKVALFRNARVNIESTNVDWPHPVGAGELEAWICDQCGFTEWFAVDASPKLHALVASGVPGIRLVSTADNRGPFR